MSAREVVMPSRVGFRISGQRRAQGLQKNRSNRNFRFTVAAFILILLSAAAGAAVINEGNGSTAELDAYRTAIASGSIAQRDAGLIALISAHSTSSLKKDALEILAWDHYRAGKSDDAIRYATELQKLNADNPLAMAILLALQPPDNAADSTQLSILRTALARVAQITRPIGLDESEFKTLTQQVTAILAGFVGHAELERKQYAAAREHLRQAATAAPNHPAYAYELALADLNGPKSNDAEAFWYLARAVVLSHGTPEGKQVAEFAAAKYREAGGTSTDWQKFLTAASGSGASQVLLASAKPTSISPAKATTVAKSSTNKPAVAKVSTNKEAAKKEPTLNELSPPPPRAETAWKPPARAPLVKPGEPYSLGILIEASALSHSTRSALVQGLSEIARNLRPEDEAFILSFGDQLDFQQDLTQNYRLLESAVDQIRPQRGSALLDAVSFAASHLKRIAKNKYRVLLVVSDGDENAAPAAAPLSAAVNELRIYCIGLGVGDENNRSLLQTLASRTGGGVSFIESPEQFETATLHVAQAIYRGKPF